MQTLISPLTHNSAVQVSTATANAIARAQLLMAQVWQDLPTHKLPAMTDFDL